METSIAFLAGEILLEGVLQRNPGERGVVITHPHSLYGGDMYNPVVEAMSRVYGKNGFSTLRFNFRGVGSSKGRFDDGRGEEQDVLAAVRFMIESGMTSVHLAGYSFGARVIAGIKELPREVHSQLHVAPPVAFMDYSGIADINGLQAVIVGADDDIAPLEQIKKLLAGWNPDADLISLDGTDHFFSGSLDRLERTLDEAVK